jgi:hypothetical protein
MNEERSRFADGLWYAKRACIAAERVYAPIRKSPAHAAAIHAGTIEADANFLRGLTEAGIAVLGEPPTQFTFSEISAAI